MSDKRKIFQILGAIVALLAIFDVFALEFGFLPTAIADAALNILIGLLALCILGSFFFKKRD